MDTQKTSEPLLFWYNFNKEEYMGRKKGTVTNYYTKEEKEKYIKEALAFGVRATGRKYKISNGMISNWIKSYQENGQVVVDNRYKRGNPLSRLQKKKNLTEKEELELEIMKLRIENERLKKGYQVKGDGTIVVFKK